MTTQSHSELAQLPVGRIAATLPGATAVLRSFKVNYCCHGDVSLAEAARQQGANLTDLAKALCALESSSALSSLSVDTNTLIDHILNRYHDVHRRELSALVELARKVEAVHASHPKAPHGLAQLLHQMRGELELHMKKEELILFPAMRRGLGALLAGPIVQMRHDHDDHGECLRKLAHLTDDFTPPTDACRSWQALSVGTAKLSEDLMEHIHLENNVLFPRFQAMPR